MADLVERSAAIDKMCGDCKSGYDGHCPHPHGMCHECESIWQTPKADIPAINRWILCSERLPELLQNVIVCTDINTVTVAWINGDHWTFADTGNGHTEDWSFDDVKYWMPLPETPKENAENG